MLRHGGQTLYSASDLVNFMGCAHATVLDVGNLATPTSFVPDDDSAVLLQEKGIEHERAYLERLRAEGRSIAEISSEGTLEQRAQATREAMQAGYDVVYQGAFLAGQWHGYSDFLLKRDDVPSSLGDFTYDVADTKLARSAKPKHILQLCVYADMLRNVQGVAPPSMHVVLGSGDIVTLPTSSLIHYFTIARERFEGFAAAVPDSSAGDPCGHCSFCRWSDHCTAEWEAADHLSIVAGMGRSQRSALREAGIDSIGALAALPPGARIPGMQAGTVAKLAAQARLQAHQRQTGEGRIELLEAAPGRGFARLPHADEGDMFFDMEGDPLFEGGLEYLFGLVALDQGEDRFHVFWAHDRESEKIAFEQAIDFMTARLARHPLAHIYHYASYEETALKRLAMYHGTREQEVDDLLRGDRLVDLYKVVAEAIRTSEPRYSIKNMEAFYLPGGRHGAVKTAGDSIVIYERWRRVGGDELLAEIADYNEIDCRSTRLCRDWLLSLRPDGTPWFTGRTLAPADPAKVAAREEADERTRQLAVALIAAEDTPWRRLLVDLLEFHRREAKPSWWAMFARQEMDADALLDDAECLANLQPHPTLRAWADKKSVVHPFTFPPQDFKMKVGDKPLRSGTLEPAGEIMSLDEDTDTIELKLGPSRSAIEPGTALIPEGPVGDKILRAAVHRYAQSVANGEDRYVAVTAILRRDRPKLAGRTSGQAIVPEGTDATDGAIDALSWLDDSYLLVQGPPGAGKTYTSAEAIVALLAAGKRIGVASNSHKAINNLLKDVEAKTAAKGLRYRGMKKSSRDDQILGSDGWIADVVGGSGSGVSPHHQLVAGTAWLFAREDLDGTLDYLFIDEAGQVSLANVIAMGTAARNIVLVGDQMQLSQPIKGTHPGGSGRSALDHLLEGHATVPADQGVFLPISRRMHPDLCTFISEAVYEGRLQAETSTTRQHIDVNVAADPAALAATGLRFVAVDHSGRAQRSPEEAERLATTYCALLGASWTDQLGERHEISAEDILVVSPYNMQVELLRRTLPEGARVGTVDKFQGQEAPVVLISMSTSSGDDLPRNIEFLYSRNRLNVAISRARCLAVIFANPKLLEIPCTTIAQMELVDGLCWAKQFADNQRDQASA
ncbi:TM0106 family RecB-like putative nuclease [Sphingobium sp.]|uniref:TM0106 family RecB-like putative nuclease n=1 Tax=Sphingobium sp. TaxID=1912891 RepID=UPI002CE5F8DD|nr:TM0106 family RecB-like putative nuclease [Sphingobium sp.]HUD92891.1 TM0106 family RecB-like putative nuclease [Sphingobium sp.]